jgi:predicted transcriptional regulator
MEKEDRIIELLETLVKIELGPVIAKELKDKKMQKLYELTGKNNVTELKNKLNISLGTISNIWQKWESLGLIKKEGKSYKKII